MVIPAGENVHINLRSSDVIHGFYVHDFNFSRFAQPGIKNEFTLNATKTGTFFGQCTQLCGLYHSLMFFKVKVVTPEAYQVWLKSFNTPAGIAAYNAAKNASSQQISSQVGTKPTSSSGAN
jgi:cytochrome c oxidase subunit 2